MFMSDPLLTLTDEPLETERLVIRRTTLEDADAISRVLSDEETALCAGLNSPHATVEVTRAYINSLLTSPHLFSVYTLILRATGSSVGVAVFSQDNIDTTWYRFRKTGTSEPVAVSIVLRRDAWGNGLAPEAMCALMNRMLHRQRADYTDANNAVVAHAAYDVAAAAAAEAAAVRARAGIASSGRDAGDDAGADDDADATSDAGADAKANADDDADDDADAGAGAGGKQAKPLRHPCFFVDVDHILFCARVQSTNKRSIKVLKKLGFKHRTPVLRFDGRGNELVPEALYARLMARGQTVTVRSKGCVVA
jgi:RimJ/RimL family protein N-acetyltransferase